AGAQSDAHSRRGAPCPRSPQGIGVTDRNARWRRRAAADGRAREDDRRAARCGTPRRPKRQPRLLLSFNPIAREDAKEATMIKKKFIIGPHFRLHEWVAEEKGYFKAEGLDYEFREAFKGQDLARAHATANKVGAYQNIEAGRDSNVSCACHWTVNVAASKGHAKMDD